MAYEKPAMKVFRLEEADLICASTYTESSGNKGHGNNGNGNGYGHTNHGNGNGYGHYKK